MNAREYRKTKAAWERFVAGEGLSTAELWLALHTKFGWLDARRVEKKALRISEDNGWYVCQAKCGGYAMDARAIRLAVNEEVGEAARLGPQTYAFVIGQERAECERSKAENERKMDKLRRKSAGEYRSKKAAEWRGSRQCCLYKDIMALFRSKGGSFDAWCRRMGFDERQARHAVVHPEWRHPAYTRIRKALRAALETLNGEDGSSLVR